MWPCCAYDGGGIVTLSPFYIPDPEQILKIRKKHGSALRLPTIKQTIAVHCGKF